MALLRPGKVRANKDRSRDAALIIGDTFIPLFKNQEGIFELGLKIPKAEKLSLGLSENGKNYDIALAWEIVP